MKKLKDVLDILACFIVAAVTTFVAGVIIVVGVTMAIESLGMLYGLAVSAGVLIIIWAFFWIERIENEHEEE